MTRLLRGIIRGRTIELNEDFGAVDGQPVEVQVTLLSPKKSLPGPPPGWRPGSTRTTAGMLADCCTDEDDRILEDIYQDRKRESRREIAE